MAKYFIIFGSIYLILFVFFIIYMVLFDSPHPGQNEIINIPDGDDYKKHEDKMISMIKNLNNIPYEKVKIQSYDGLTLSAKYYHIKDGAPLAICFHGYRGTGVRDFSGGATLIMEMGENVLLIDERAQGESKGKTITFGANEKYDAESWIDYSIKRFGNDVKIILYGVSMGAATVILASSLNLKENVKAIVADSSYTSAKDIILDVAKKKYHVPNFLMTILLYPASLIFGQFLLKEADVMKALKNAKLPILLIHGESDSFVPIEMGKRLADSRPDLIEFHTFPDAAHGISFIVDEERYKKIATNFINKYLN